MICEQQLTSLITIYYRRKSTASVPLAGSCKDHISDITRPLSDRLAMRKLNGRQQNAEISFTGHI